MKNVNYKSASAGVEGTCRYCIVPSTPLRDQGYNYHTSTIGLGCEGLVVGWTLGVGSVAANEGGYKEIPFSYQYAPAQTIDL